MSPREEWVRVDAFSTRGDAEEARSALTARGITSTLHVEDGEAGGGMPRPQQPEGVEVRVAPADWESARETLGLPVHLPSERTMRPVVLAVLALLVVAIVTVVVAELMG